MHRIKLNATDSTNAYLRRLLDQSDLPDATTVQADSQTKGRGMPGASWQSESGKNLTFSLLKHFKTLVAADHFQLNMAVSLGLVSALEDLDIPGLSVKWPNDILSGTRKICGILIENKLQGGRILHSIIGVGLNVNQLAFEGLPRAGSLAGVTGRPFELEGLLDNLLERLNAELDAVRATPYEETCLRYEARLFGKDRPCVFDVGRAPKFNAMIRGVDRDGRLLLETEDGRRQAWGFRELRMFY